MQIHSTDHNAFEGNVKCYQLHIMTSEGENNIKAANGTQEEDFEDDPDFIQEGEDLEEDLALEARDSFEENGGYPAYLYEQEQRSGGIIKNSSFSNFIVLLLPPIRMSKISSDT